MASTRTIIKSTFMAASLVALVGCGSDEAVPRNGETPFVAEGTVRQVTYLGKDIGGIHGLLVVTLDQKSIAYPSVSLAPCFAHAYSNDVKMLHRAADLLDLKEKGTRVRLTGIQYDDFNAQYKGADCKYLTKIEAVDGSKTIQE